MRRNPHIGAVLQQRFGWSPARPHAPRPRPPMLAPDQLRDLSLCHHANLDAIATGTAEPSMLWDYTGGVFTWWKASRLIGQGEPEMDLQLEVATRLVERFGRHGRVLFDGPDLQLARDGVVVMDLVAQACTLAQATEAADWSEREIRRMASAVQLLQQQDQQEATCG